MPVWIRSGGATAIAALIVFCAGYGFAWYTISGHHAAEISAKEEQNAKALTSAHQKAEWIALWASMEETERYNEMRKVEHANNLLADAVARDTKRLRVAATCPLPENAAGASVDHGRGPELDAGARPAYFALRNGIGRMTAQLGACQNILRLERE